MQYNDYPFSDDNMGLYLPTPFFKAYPLQTVYDDERRQERDADYFKSMYPNAARRLFLMWRMNATEWNMRAA